MILVVKKVLFTYVFFVLFSFFGCYNILSLNNKNVKINNNDIITNNKLYISDGFFNFMNNTAIFDFINSKLVEGYGFLGELSSFFNKVDLSKLLCALELRMFINQYILPYDLIEDFFDIDRSSYIKISNLILIIIVLKYYDFFILK